MKIIVEQGWRAVVRRDGVVVDVLGPGRHRLPRPFWRRRVDLVDVRERTLVLTGQELTTVDVPGVKVSAAARWRVTDPVAWLDRAEDPAELLRLAIQLALRDHVTTQELSTLVLDRAAATLALTAAVAADVAELGIAVTEVAVRDVVAPGELRRATLALATARREGLAALERARGETAALRALANGARVLEQHPDLARLRLAQATAESGGQVVLRVGDPGRVDAVQASS